MRVGLRALCAPASRAGRADCRSRDWDPRPERSAPRAACALCRSQRCLLSSPTDCLISSTVAWISARIAILESELRGEPNVRSGERQAARAAHWNLEARLRDARGDTFRRKDVL